MTAARDDLPTGTVTFLFTDIEGSTGLAQGLDTGTYRALLEQHHRLLRSAIASHAGVERGTQGDAFLVIFRDAPSAVAAAVEAQRALAGADWPDGGSVAVRMGLHSGEGIRGGDDYVGLDINRAARIASAAHGGQVLVSESTRALAARTLPPGVALRDVGEHRLKGLEAPERLHQLTIEGLQGEFPPLRTLGGRSTLPPRLTSFVGRREELDDLGRLLERARLLTLVGPGGTGKTSLATELARESAAQFSDGAWFVALDSLASHDLVGSAIVAGLDLRGPSEKPIRERLIENLSARAVLLVLDNFEHVLDAAPLVGDLLASAPELRVVVTSRAPLRLSGEQIYPVPPLALPREGADDAAIASAASVRLFVDRARGAQPGFELTAENADAISEICLRLDGLPLGIELAAARIGLFGAKGIRDRLVQHIALPASPIRDAPTRQRTLHDAIAWSHGLLAAPARALFARMSVFAGGCRLEELEPVCGAATELGGEPVELLTELIDHSLVISGDRDGAVRFQMLETIREFAEAELTRSPDREGPVRRHALAYLALAERAAPDFELARRRPALELLTPERDNVRAAVEWAVASDEGEVALRLCVAVGFFWAFRGEFVDAVTSTEAALALPSAASPSIARMRALDAAGTLRYYGGDADGAHRLYSEQLEVALALGDAKGIADARFNLMFTEDWKGRAGEALAAFDGIAAEYRRLGDERFLARADWGRANYMFELGREAEAVELIEGLVGRFRALDDPRYESMALGSLASAAMERGDRQSALRLFLASFGRDRDLGDVAGVTTALPILATAALELAGPEPAATIMAAYEALSKRYGLRMPRTLEQFIASVDIDPLEVARGALDPETFARATERGREMAYSDVGAYVQEVFGSGAGGGLGGAPDQAGGQVGGA